MGRTEPSSRPPPQSFRRAARAKEARRTINKVIPSLLSSDQRAKKGIAAVELIVDAFAWDPVVSAGGAGGLAARKKAGHERKGSTDTSATTGFGGKPPGKATGKNKKGRRKGDDSSEDEQAIEEIKAAKAAKAKKLDTQGAKDELADEKKTSPAVDLKIKILVTDSLTAARLLNQTLKGEEKEWTSIQPPTPFKLPVGAAKQQTATSTVQNAVSVLNMASPLRPGGGFFSGATSQEEHLCMRTTLIHSLHENFYRLPEYGVIYTPDVLVFRPGDRDRLKAGGHDLLRRRERFYVSVASAGMLRFPDVEGGEEIEGGDGAAEAIEKSYIENKDRQAVEKKMRGVLRVMAGKGAKGVVLGAWGCGAYGNPVGEIARAWKKVLLSNDSNFKDQTSNKSGAATKASGKSYGDHDIGSVSHVVFAIKDAKMAEDFAQCWGDGLKAEYLPDPNKKDAGPEIDEELERLEQEREELEQKIQEMEDQLTQTKFPARLEWVLKGLRKQLVETIAAIRARRGTNSEDEDKEDGVGANADSEEDDSESSDEENEDDDDGESEDEQR